MPDYKNKPAGIEKLLPWSDFIKEHCTGLIDVGNITPEKQEPIYHNDWCVYRSGWGFFYTDWADRIVQIFNDWKGDGKETLLNMTVVDGQKKDGI